MMKQFFVLGVAFTGMMVSMPQAVLAVRRSFEVLDTIGEASEEILVRGTPHPQNRGGGAGASHGISVYNEGYAPIPVNSASVFSFKEEQEKCVVQALLGGMVPIKSSTSDLKDVLNFLEAQAQERKNVRVVQKRKKTPKKPKAPDVLMTNRELRLSLETCRNLRKIERLADNPRKNTKTVYYTSEQGIMFPPALKAWTLNASIRLLDLGSLEELTLTHWAGTLPASQNLKHLIFGEKCDLTELNRLEEKFPHLESLTFESDEPASKIKLDLLPKDFKEIPTKKGKLVFQHEKLHAKNLMKSWRVLRKVLGLFDRQQ